MPRTSPVGEARLADSTLSGSSRRASVVSYGGPTHRALLVALRASARRPSRWSDWILFAFALAGIAWMVGGAWVTHARAVRGAAERAVPAAVTWDALEARPFAAARRGQA